MPSTQQLNFVLTVTDKVSAKMKTLGKSFKNFGSNFDNISKKAEGMAGTFTGVGVGAGFLSKKLVDLASDAEETTNKMNEVFGESASVIESFAKNAAKSTGSSTQEFKDMAATLGNLLIPMGFTEKAAAGVSSEMVQLAADLGSFNNIPTAQALDKIRAGLIGEAEPLRSLGIQLSAARIQQEAFTLGLAKTKDQVVGNIKAEATLSLIRKDSIKSQGDFMRTSDGLANSQKIATAQFKDAAKVLGENLIPIATKLVNLATVLIGKFNDMSPAIKKVVAITIALVAAIGLVGGPILFLIGKIPVLIAVVKALGIALQFLALNPIGLIITGIGVMILLIIKLVKEFDEFKANLLIIFDAIVKKMPELKQSFVNTFESIKSVVFSVFNAISTFVTTQIDNLKAKFDVVTNFISKIRNAITSAKDTVSGFFGGDEEGQEQSNIIPSPVNNTNRNLSSQQINVNVTGNNIASEGDARTLASEIESNLIRSMQLNKLGA